MQNNPILRIDPLGLTDYTINDEGKISKVKGTDTDDGPDRLIKGTPRYRKGKLRKSNDYIEVDRGSFDNLTEENGLQILTLESGENAENIYSFITGKNEPTEITNSLGEVTGIRHDDRPLSDVEFDKVSTVGSDGSATTHILTSGDTETVKGGSQYVINLKAADPGMKLIDITHNHGNPNRFFGAMGTRYPSGSLNPPIGDLGKAKASISGPFRGQLPQPTFHIRRYGKDYPYTPN